jgi:uncharacterized membrane protein YphA (DoxX/SURF4 family)
MTAPPEKTPRWLVVLTALVALTFAVTGSSKLANVAPSPENFARWGYSMTFMHLIGGVEIAGALGLLLPRLSPFAALGLIATMIGAARTGIVNSEPFHVVVPIVLIALLAMIVYGRRRELSKLARPARRA